MKKKKVNKIQKREIIIKEYDDGTYEIIGAAWNIDNIKPKDIIEAFTHWKSKNLEVYPNKLEILKLIKDNTN